MFTPRGCDSPMILVDQDFSVPDGVIPVIPDQGRWNALRRIRSSAIRCESRSSHRPRRGLTRNGGTRCAAPAGRSSLKLAVIAPTINLPRA